ncbi:MAG: metallophosphoesterase [Traorella sp.]
MRKVLQIILCLLLLTGCKTSKKYLPKDTPIKIMVASDLHYLADDLHDGQKTCENLYQARDGKIVQYGKEILLTFIDTIIQEKPDVLILSGDLTLNGEKQSHEELASIFQKVLDESIPILVIPGNHDIRSPYAISYTGEEAMKTKTIEKDDFKKIYQDFGYQNADSKDKDSLSYLYKLSEDIWFMMLDTSLYEKNSGLGIYGISKFRDSTINWMEKCFKEAQSKNALIIPVTHQVLLENEAIYLGENRIQNHEALTSLMAEYGSFVSLSGHIHAQLITSNEINGKTLYEITSESLAVPQNRYGIIMIQNNTFTYESKPLDVQGWALSNQIDDENLLNFEEYSWNHFVNVTYKNFMSRYEDSNLENKEIIVNLFASLNPYYFNGRIDEIREQTLQSNEYQILNESKDEYAMNYIHSILYEQKLNQLSLEIQYKK